MGSWEGLHAIYSSHLPLPSRISGLYTCLGHHQESSEARTASPLPRDAQKHRKTKHTKGAQEVIAELQSGGSRFQEVAEDPGPLEWVLVHCRERMMQNG